MASDPHTHQDDPSTWPPGTVTLEELRFATEGTPDGFEIVLVPTPSADVNDPLNWKAWEKRLNFGLTLLYSLIIFALISAITPTWAPMMGELGFTLPDVNNSYATGTATLAVGALIFIPLALRYGRRPIYIFSLVGQIAVAVWAANIKNKGDLYGIQAMNCLLGALVEVIVQMTIADIFFVHQRGLMNNLYVCVMSVGTSMAGLVAGYITVGQGWRWVWWWFAIALAICLVAFIFFYEETRFVQQIDGVVEAVPATKLADRSSIGDEDDNKKPIEDQLRPIPSAVTQAAIPRKTYLQRLSPFSHSTGSLTNLMHHVYQPLLVMCTIPAVIYVALLYGFVTAALQVSLTLIASYMPAPPYNFDAAAIGLMSLPVLIGNFVGFVLSAPFSDRIILLLARKNKGIYEPEMRLWLLLGFAPFFSGGLILFGYALAKGMSWPIVALGLGISSAALTPIASVSLAYLTDAYTDIIADAVVGVTFVRNALATTFVLALTPWVAKVQLQNVMLTFGMLTALILCGGTVVMLVFGKRLRIATVGAYQFYAKKQIDTRQ